MPLPHSRPLYDPSQREPALDGLRGVAIVLVLLTHGAVVEPRGLAESLTLAPLKLGWCGVDQFFVLSGFLITSILLATRGGPGYFTTFYARRALRLLPLYFAWLAVVFLVLPHFALPNRPAYEVMLQHQAYYWAMLSNYWMAWQGNFGHGLLAVTWSLAIEEQFYLLWPAVVLACGPAGLRRLCPLLVLASLVCRVALGLYGASPTALYTLTPCRLDGLAIGSLIAVWVNAGYRPTAGARWLLALAGGCYAVALAAEAAHLRRAAGAEYQYAPLVLTVGITLLSVAAGALLLATLSAGTESRVRRLLCAAPLRSLGRYSYGIYLLHLPVRSLLRDYLIAPPGSDAHPLIQIPAFAGSRLPAVLAFCAVLILASWMVGWLSFWLWERPFLLLKRWLPYGGGLHGTPRQQP